MADSTSATPTHEAPIVLLLVHGTFAPDASWTRGDSALIARLTSTFPTHRMIVDTFTWRGVASTRYNNTHAHRHAAATALAKRLQQIRTAHPLAKIVVVAHSHGGNVSLYAARKCAPETTLDGVVCMGTPFIEIAPRNVREDVVFPAAISLSAVVAWVALLTMSTLVGLAGVVTGLVLLANGPGVLIRVAGATLALVSLPVGSWFLEIDEEASKRQAWSAPPTSSNSANPYGNSYYGSGQFGGPYAYGSAQSGSSSGYSGPVWRMTKTAREMPERWSESWTNGLYSFAERKQARLAGLFTAVVESSSCPVLCVNTPHDEAFLALSAIDRVSWFVAALLSHPNVATGLYITVLAACGLRGVTFAVNVTPRLFDDAPAGLGSSILYWVGFVLTGVVAALGAGMFWLMIATLALWVLTPLVLAARVPAGFGTLLAYGWMDLLAGMFVEMRVRSTPAGWDHRPVGSELREYTFANREGMHHSTYYTNPDVLTAIAEWLTARVRAN
jgi:hypothetical protein